ncbi:MAG TPA: nucleoside triphosphate pyrophosphohydrolase [Symbiobacteriaceae bacterium]|nr:nucleoside triphosphate pyrophosphohydrolase [Symbiobacteriaceae bacterium]
MIDLVCLGQAGVATLPVAGLALLQSERPVLLAEGFRAGEMLLARLGVTATGRVDAPEQVLAVADPVLLAPRRSALVAALRDRAQVALVEPTGTSLLEAALAAVSDTVQSGRAGSGADGATAEAGLLLLEQVTAPQSLTPIRPLLLLMPGPDDVAALNSAYPLDHPVALLRPAAGALEAEWTLLSDTEAKGGIDYLSALYVPPLAPSLAGDPKPAHWQPKRWSIDPLVTVMAKLRGPNGCPWDLEQTHASLRRYMLEEAYEAIEAMESGDMKHLCEELGDVLLQVVFHAQIASESGHFTIDEIVEGITAKLVRRHPHVFGDVSVRDAAEVNRNWEAIKQQEKGGKAPESILTGVGKGLPALTKANALQKRAAKVGFDWPDLAGPVAKVHEELDELLQAPPAEREGELGDLLFAVVNVARVLGIEPELALHQTNAKFMRRFQQMEEMAAHQGLTLSDMTLEALDRLWDEAKKRELG